MWLAIEWLRSGEAASSRFRQLELGRCRLQLRAVREARLRAELGAVSQSMYQSMSTPYATLPLTRSPIAAVGQYSAHHPHEEHAPRSITYATRSR
jgi:hypothetical protein